MFSMLRSLLRPPLERWAAASPLLRRFLVVGIGISATTWLVGYALSVHWGGDSPWGPFTTSQVVWGSRAILLCFWSFFMLGQFTFRPAYEAFDRALPWPIAVIRAFSISSEFRSVFFWTTTYFLVVVAANVGFVQAVVVQFIGVFSVIALAFACEWSSGPYPGFSQQVVLFGVRMSRQVAATAAASALAYVGNMAHSSYEASAQRSHERDLTSAQHSHELEKSRMELEKSKADLEKSRLEADRSKRWW